MKKILTLAAVLMLCGCNNYIDDKADAIAQAYKGYDVCMIQAGNVIQTALTAHDNNKISVEGLNAVYGPCGINLQNQLIEIGKLYP